MTGSISGLDVGEVSPSGRVLTLRIATNAGMVDLKATDLRTILGAGRLRSTMFMVRTLGGDPPIVEFTGRGSGHGVGMSQWGARGQALLGRTYQDILRYYYTGITFETR